MSDSSDTSGQLGSAGSGSGSAGSQGGQGGQRGQGGQGGGSTNRNRSRNRSRNRQGSGGGASPDAGNRPARAGGTRAQGGSGGSASTRSRAGRPPGGPPNRSSGSARSGTGGSNRAPAQRRSSHQRQPEATPARSPSTPDRHVEGNEEATAYALNRRRAALICITPALGAGLVVAIVLVAAGLPVFGVAAFVVVTLGVATWLWWAAPALVVRSVGAAPSDEHQHPRLHNLVDGLCATMGLARPTICVVQSAVPNAMSVGRDPDSAMLIVTSGLDQSLSLVELEGVLAHELVHIKRNDTAVAALAVVAAAPWAAVRGREAGAEVVHRLVGRGREYAADLRAAEVVRYPPGIASALGAMVEGQALSWPPTGGLIVALTRWLWIDPLAGSSAPVEEQIGNLDDTRVRAAALSLR